MLSPCKELMLWMAFTRSGHAHPLFSSRSQLCAIGRSGCSRWCRSRSVPAGRAMAHHSAIPVQNTAAVNTRHAARLIRKQRFNDRPFEFRQIVSSACAQALIDWKFHTDCGGFVTPVYEHMSSFILPPNRAAPDSIRSLFGRTGRTPDCTIHPSAIVPCRSRPIRRPR